MNSASNSDSVRICQLGRAGNGVLQDDSNVEGGIDRGLGDEGLGAKPLQPVDKTFY